MQIQPINNVQYLNSQKLQNRKRVNNANYNPSFKSFESELAKAVIKDFENSIYATGAFEDIYRTIINNPNVIKMPELILLENHGIAHNPEKILYDLCRPIAKVPSDLRDMVFKANNECMIPLAKKNGEEIMYLEHRGKYGFFSSLFNSEDARSDVRIKLVSFPEHNEFEMSLTKDKWLRVRQEREYSWDEYILGLLSCKSHKSGDINSSTSAAFYP